MDISGLLTLGAPHWLALGLVLLLAELTTGTTYLLWPAVAAWITGALLLFLPLGLPAQLLVFGGLTLVTTLTGRHYVKGRLLAGGDPSLNEPLQKLVGARGVAATAFENGEGRVRLGDSEWRGESADAIAAGDQVEVLSVSGATVRVARRAQPALTASSRG